MNSAFPSAATDAAHAPQFVQVHREDAAELRAELLQGLRQPNAEVSPKFLYDALGSRLFEAITELPEYYPTRTEAAIFTAHGAAMAQAIGAGVTLIDLGAGNCAKAARLLTLLDARRYVAIDISVDFLREALQALSRVHPSLPMLGLGLDFSTTLGLPADACDGLPAFFYPGSSIGNFNRPQALAFLRRIREQATDGGLLIGVDLVKPVEILEPAYDDALGVTAAFNLNLLRYLNRLIGSDFDPRQWQHVALYNCVEARIEMHLQARDALTVAWPGGKRTFRAGERIHTENSYKHELEGFATLLREAGFATSRHWTDPQRWFAVFWAGAA
ncbi:MAG: L-histidine N(alpha)-methyltransferase [Burkholderiaceae bacterium]